MSQNSVMDAKVIALWQRRDSMIDPVITTMTRYWESLRDAGDIPRRAQVDPKAFREALPYAFVLERARPGTVRFRLAGQHLAQLMGMDVRGMPLRSMFELPDRQRLIEQVELVFEGPSGLNVELVSDAQVGRSLEARLMLLPLRGVEGKINKALGVLVADGVVGLPPRRFRIRKHTLHPIPVGTDTKAPNLTSDMSGGLQEPAANYQAGPAPERPNGPPVLTVLRGGKADP